MRSKDLATTGILTLLSVACGGSTPPPAPPSPIVVVDTVRIVDTVEVEVAPPEDDGLDREVARLKIQLLEREAAFYEVRQQLSGERQEVVRNLAKLQSQASRAEAASEMAEAEIAVRALTGAPGASGEAVEAASGLLAQSTSEFNKQNYGGALYLATQARSLVSDARSQLRSADRGELQEGEAYFTLAVPLVTNTTSNVREGPGTRHAVRFVLPEGSPAQGVSYTNEWIYLRDREGREGWIFHNLVKGRN